MISELVWTCVLVLHGVCSVGSDVELVSVKKGDPVTLHNDINVTKKDDIKWFFNSTCIAEIDPYKRKNCTDVQCNEEAERFRDRLKLDHQTGSLTIMKTTFTDSGLYKLNILKDKTNEKKSFTLTVYEDTTTDKNEIENKAGTEDSGLSGGAIAGICVGVLVPCIAVAGFFYYMFQKRNGRQPGNGTTAYTGVSGNNNETENGEAEEMEMQPMQ